ncbi:MAG: SPOR domain-containing protein [Luteibaculum sp.]
MIRYRYEKQFSALLIQNERVVIPGIGGFLVYSIPAEIAGEDARIYPPGKKLRFYAGLVDERHELAQQVSNYFDIDQASAEALVETEGAQIAQALQENKKLLLPGVGSIYLKEAELHFEECPVQDSIICPEPGLESVALPAAIVKLRAIKGDAAHSAIKPKEIKTGKNKQWLKIAASLALPICIGAGLLIDSSGSGFIANLGGIGNEVSQYQTRGYIPSLIDNEEEINMLAEKSIQGNGIQVLNINESHFAVQLPEKVNTKFQYQIIAGCFKELSNANTAVEDLKAQGHDAYIAEFKHGLYRVCIGKYQNKTEVKEAMKKASKALGLDLWYVKI